MLQEGHLRVVRSQGDSGRLVLLAHQLQLNISMDSLLDSFLVSALFSDPDQFIYCKQIIRVVRFVRLSQVLIHYCLLSNF